MWKSFSETGLLLVILLHLTKGFTLNLCDYFVRGATCSNFCAYEALHSWGIPLCIHNGALGPRCCIPPDHPLIQMQTRRRKTTTTTVPSTTVTMTPSSCGHPRSHSRLRRVVGGSEAPPGTWPWQVAIRLYTGQYLCGGMVISDRWILTAAHCLHSPYNDVNLLRIYAGNQRLSYDTDGRDNYKTISRAIPHEHFRHNVEVNVTDTHTGHTSVIRRHFHDMALVELTEPLIYSDNLQPICLPELDELGTEIHDPNDCLVAGWGEDNDLNDDPTVDLQEVHGEALGHTQCGVQWGTRFSSDVICFTSQRRGPCKGDSGGGMICRNPDGGYSLVGVISWGRDDCVHDDHPSVLAKVQAYRAWIESYINSPSY